MQADFDLAKEYLERAKRDMKEDGAEDALFHSRKALEAALKIICKATGTVYRTLEGDMDLYSVIDLLFGNRLISSEDRYIMHRIRAGSNKGAHVNMDPHIDYSRTARESIELLQDLIIRMEAVDWDLAADENRQHTGRQSDTKRLKLKPFIPNI